MQQHFSPKAATMRPRRRIRQFSTVELAVAMAILLVISVGVTFTLTRTMQQTNRAIAEQGADRALAIAMEHTVGQNYVTIADETFNKIDACDADGTPNASGSFSCVTVADVEYVVDYDIAVSDAADDGGDPATFLIPTNTYLDVKVSTNAGAVERTRRVAPPTAGFVDGFGVLRVSAVSATGDVPTDINILLLDSSSTMIGSAKTFNEDGVAVFTVPNNTCTRTDTCQIGLQTGTDWWRTSTAPTGYDYEWGIAGARARDGIVVPDNGNAETNISLFEAGEIKVNLYAKGDTNPRRVLAQNAGSICMWATFLDDGTLTSAPVCNMSSASLLTLTEFTPTGSTNSYLYPAGTTLTLTTDHPDDTCPAVPGMQGYTAEGWDTRAVCTSWTWGYPSLWSITGETPVSFDPDAGVVLTLEGAQSQSFDLVWTGSTARPAAGYPGEDQWKRPRTSEFCSLDATCQPIGADVIPEATACDSGTGHCLSAANSTPVPTDPGPQTIEAGTPHVIEIGGTDADNDPLTLVVTTLPASGKGTLYYNNVAVVAGTPIYISQPSGTVAQLVYETSYGLTGVPFFTFTVSDGNSHNGTSAPLQVNLNLSAGIALITGNTTTVTQGTTGVVVTATVLDGYNQPYPGAVVTFTNADSGVFKSSSTAVTNASGVATITVDFLGASVGDHTFILSAEGVNGQAVVTVESILSRIEAQYGEISQGSSGNITLVAYDLANQPAGGIILTPADISGPVLARASVGHNGDGTQVPTNAGRYYDATFYQGIAVTQGTENLIENPGFNSIATGYSPGWDDALNGTLQPATAWGSGYNGGVQDPDLGYHAHIVETGGVAGTPGFEYIDENAEYGWPLRWMGTAQLLAGNVSSELGWGHGTQVTISFDLKTNHVDKYIRAGLYHKKADNSGNTFTGGCLTALKPENINEWDRVSVTCTLNAADWNFAEFSNLYMYGNGATNGTEARGWVDNIQVETLHTATGMQEGVRTDEILGIPGAGVIEGDAGTVSMLFEPFGSPQSNGILFQYGGGETGPVTQDDLRIEWGTTDGVDKVSFTMASKAAGTQSTVAVTIPGGLSKDTPYWVSARWGVPGTLYLDVTNYDTGVTVSGTTGVGFAPPLFTGASTALIGSNGNAGTFTNIIVDELHVSNIPRSNGEIATAHAAFLPPEADLNTNFLSHFNGTPMPVAGITLGSNCTTGGLGTCETSTAVAGTTPAGTYRTTVTSGGFTGYGPLTVLPVASTITTPGTISLPQSSQETLTITALDGAGVPLIGQVVNFNESSPLFSISDTAVVTDLRGSATITITATPSAAPGSGTITVSNGGSTVDVVVDLVAAPTTWTGGTFHTEPEFQKEYSITVYDDNSNTIEGAAVVITSSDPENTAVGNVEDGSPETALMYTDSSGVATFVMSTYGDVPPATYADLLTVEVGNLPAETRTVVVEQRIFSIEYNAADYHFNQGTSTTVSFTAYDNVGNPVNGPTIPGSAGVAVSSDVTDVTFNPSAVTVNATGQASFQITAATTSPAGSAAVLLESTRMDDISTTIIIDPVLASIDPVQDPVPVMPHNHSELGFEVTDIAGGVVSGQQVTIEVSETSLNLRPVLVGDPIGWWRLGEASGVTAADSTLNGATGTYAGSLVYGRTGALNGDSDDSIRLRPLAGTDGNVALPIHPATDIPESFTIAGWFYINTDPSADAYLIGSDITAPDAFYLRIDGATGGFEYGMGSSEEAMGRLDTDGVTFLPVVPTVGAWHHFAWEVSFDQLEADFHMVSLLLDGEGVYANLDADIGTGRTSNAITLSDPVAGLDVTLDEIAIYDVALQPNAVKTQYLTGISGTPKITVGITDYSGTVVTAVQTGAILGNFPVTGDAGTLPQASLDVLVGSVPGTLQVIADNPVTNPSFEEGTLHGWSGATQVTGTPTPYHAAFTADRALDATANWEAITSDDIPVSPGDVVSIQAALRADVGGMWANVRGTLLDASHNPIGASPYLARTVDGADAGSYQSTTNRDTTFIPTNVWKVYRVSSITPIPVGVSYIRLEAFTESAGAGHLYMDDMRVDVTSNPDVVASTNQSVLVEIELLDTNGLPMLGDVVTITTDSPEGAFTVGTITTNAYGRGTDILVIPAGATTGSYSITATDSTGIIVAIHSLEIVDPTITGLLATYYELDGDQKNLAQLDGAVVTASSSRGKNLPEAAADGQYAGSGGEWRSDGGGTGSWLSFDLGSPQNIDEIVVYDRFDPTKNFVNGTIQFSLNGSTWFGTTNISNLPINGEAYRVPVTQNARYVKLTAGAGVVGTNVGLAEVKILQGAELVDMTDTNVINVTASSEFSADYLVTNVIDNHKPDSTNPTVGGVWLREWATLGGVGAGNYVTFKLQRDAWIHSIVVYDRPNLTDNFGDYTLRMRSNGDSEWNEVDVVIPIATDGSASVYTLPEPQRAGEIRITSNNAVGVNVGLSEVEIFGTWDSPAPGDGTAYGERVIQTIDYAPSVDNAFESGRARNVAIDATGTVDIDSSGTYTFYVDALDDAVLTVDGIEMVSYAAPDQVEWDESLRLDGDFNGDGIDDQALLEQASGSIYVMKGSAEGLGVPMLWADQVMPIGRDMSVFAGDFNGDGQTDVGYIETGGNGDVRVLASTGISFSNPIVWARLDETGLYLSGDVDDYASAADHSSLDLSGDFAIEVLMRDDWDSRSGIETIISKYDAGTSERSWRLGIQQDGTLRLVVSSTGANWYTFSSTAAVGTRAKDGEIHSIGVVFYVNSAGNSVTEFQFDGTALGSSVSMPTVGSLHQTAIPVNVSGPWRVDTNMGGTSSTIQQIKIWGNTTKTDLRAQWDFLSANAGAATVTDSSSNNNTMTLQGNAEIIDWPLGSRYGTGRADLTQNSSAQVQYGVAVDNANGTLDPERELSIEFVGSADWDSSGNIMDLVGKWNNSVTPRQNSYLLRKEADGDLRLYVALAGTDEYMGYRSTATLGSVLADGERATITAFFRPNGNGVPTYVAFAVNGIQLGSVISGIDISDRGVPTDGDYRQEVLDDDPIGYWRMGEDTPRFTYKLFDISAAYSPGIVNSAVPEGLVANWPLGGVYGSGDYSPVGRRAMTYTSVASSTQAFPYVYNSSMNTSTDKLFVTNYDQMPAQDISYTSWVNLSASAPALTPFLSYASAGSTNDLLFMYKLNRLYLNDSSAGGAGAGEMYVNYTLTPGTWYHLGMTRDASTGLTTMYVNGASVGSFTLNAGAGNTPGGTLMLTDEQDGIYDGVSDATGGFDTTQAFIGNMALVSLHDRVLSSSEIAAIYSGKDQSSKMAPENATQFDDLFDPSLGWTQLVYEGEYHDGFRWDERVDKAAVPTQLYGLQIDGRFWAPTTGTYTFAIDTDDSGDIFVDNTPVAAYYSIYNATIGAASGHGMTGDPADHSGTIALTQGWHDIRVRVEEGTGGDGLHVRWTLPGATKSIEFMGDTPTWRAYDTVTNYPQNLMTYPTQSSADFDNFIAGPDDGHNAASASQGVTTDYEAMILADGPVSYWTMAEVGGFLDQAGTNDIPTAYGGINDGDTLDANATDDDLYSTNFDGIGDYLDYGNPANLNISGDLSIEFWIFNDSFAARQCPVSKAYRGAFQFTRELSGKMNFYYGDAGAGTYTGTSSVTPFVLGQWEHYAVVRHTNNSVVDVYINGQLDVHRTGVAQAVVPGASSVLIGNGYAGIFDGKLEHIAIYNKALTAAQILEHHDVGNGLVTITAGTYTGNTHWNDGNAAWGAIGGMPAAIPADYYALEINAPLYVPVTGTYRFGVDGNDSIDVAIDGTVVSSWYGSHGALSEVNSHVGSAVLTKGWHTATIRQTEGWGGADLHVMWTKPGDRAGAWRPLPIQGAKTTFEDLSGNANLGIAHNGNDVSNSRGGVTADGDGSTLITKDGTIHMNDLPVDTTATGVTTVEFWTQWGGAMGTMPVGFEVYDLAVYPNGEMSFNTGNGDAFGTTVENFLWKYQDRWVHVVAEFHNDNIINNKIWLNGVPQTLSQLQGTSVVGRRVTPAFSVSGWRAETPYTTSRTRYDEVAIYNGALSQDRITAHFKAGVHNNYDDVILAANPIAYWPLDAEHTVNDASGHGYTLTANGGISVGTAGNRIGTSEYTGAGMTTDFDGIDDSLTLPVGTLPLDGSTPYSYEFWQYTDVIPGTRIGSFLLGPSTTGGHHVLFNKDLGYAQIGAWAAQPVVASEVGDAGQPARGGHVHYAVTYDGLTLTVYMNGEVLGTKTGTGFNLDGSLWIGDAITGGSLDGKMAHVAIYDRELTQAEVEAHFLVAAPHASYMVALDDPMAFWSLGSSGTAQGDTRNSATFTLYGDPVRQAAGVRNDTDPSIRFDGVDDWGKAPDNATIQAGGDWSMQASFNADRSDSIRVLYKQGGRNNGYTVYLRGGSLYVTVASGDHTAGWVSHPIENGRSYTMNAVADGSAHTLTLYLDGEQVDQSYLRTTPAAHTGDITLGASNSAIIDHTGVEIGTNGVTEYYFAGRIQDIALWNIPWSPERAEMSGEATATGGSGAGPITQFRNFGFESGANTGWVITDPTRLDLTTADAAFGEPVHTGRYSAKLVATANTTASETDYHSISGRVVTKEDANIDVSMWVYPVGMTRIGLYSGNGMGQMFNVTPNVWQQITWADRDTYGSEWFMQITPGADNPFSQNITNAILYIDDVKVHYNSVRAIDDSDADVIIGGRMDNDGDIVSPRYQFIGTIDRVSISSQSGTATGTLGGDLVAVWDFTRATPGDTSIPDRTGNGNTLNMRAAHSSGTHLDVPEQIIVSPAGAEQINYTVGDFTGDGKDDLSVMDVEQTGDMLVLKGGVAGFTQATWANHLSWQENNWTAHPGNNKGDVTDDVYIYNSSNRYWYLLESNGTTGFSFPGSSGQTSVASDPHVGDFNGDGKTDLLNVDMALGDAYVKLATGSGTGFGAESLWHDGSTSSGPWYPGDFTGDGKDDILRVTDAGNFYVWKSNGTTFASTGWGTEATGATENYIGDFNGDGKTDTVSYVNNPSVWTGHVSTGASFTGATWVDLDTYSTGTWECNPNSANNPTTGTPTGCATISLPAGLHDISLWARTSEATTPATLRLAYSGPDTSGALAIIPSGALSHVPPVAPLIIEEMHTSGTEYIRVRNTSTYETVVGTIHVNDYSSVRGTVPVNIIPGGYVDIHSLTDPGGQPATSLYLGSASNFWNNEGDIVTLRFDNGSGEQVLAREAYGIRAVRITDMNPDAVGTDGSNPNGEWVSIVNDSIQPWDMAGWTLTHVIDAKIYTFGSFTLDAHASVKVHPGCGTDTATDLYSCTDGGAAIWRADGTSQAELKDSAGNLASLIDATPAGDDRM